MILYSRHVGVPPLYPSDVAPLVSARLVDATTPLSEPAVPDAYRDRMSSSPAFGALLRFHPFQASPESTRRSNRHSVSVAFSLAFHFDQEFA